MIEINKIAVDSDTSDDKNVPIQNINYLGRKGKAEVFFPYGMSANVPTGFLGLLFSVLKQTSNRIAMFSSGSERLKVKTGEVAFFHPVEKQYTHYRNDGSILTKTEKCTMVVQRDGTITIDNDESHTEINNDGSQTFENGNGFIKLLASGVVDINGTTIDTSGKITTANGAVVDSDVETSAGISLDGHDHNYNPGPGSPAPTTPPNP